MTSLSADFICYYYVGHVNCPYEFMRLNYDDKGERCIDNIIKFFKKDFTTFSNFNLLTFFGFL